MSLLGFQTALGRLVRAPEPNDSTAGKPDYLALLDGLDLAPDERARLTRLIDSPGFRFTDSVQRSWCEGRAASAARLTFSIVPPGQRQRLVREWLSAGGGTNSFFASEAEAFLGFISRRLPDPSHALTLCQLERAVYRASVAAPTFKPPDPSFLENPDSLLCVGRHASLVQFFAEPQRLLAALAGGEPLPPLSDSCFPVLFAPGLPGLFSQVSSEEVALWQLLARPISLRSLLHSDRARETIEALVAVGAIALTSWLPRQQAS